MTKYRRMHLRKRQQGFIHISDTEFNIVFVLCILGLICLFCCSVYGIYWIWNHVHIVIS